MLQAGLKAGLILAAARRRLFGLLLVRRLTPGFAENRITRWYPIVL